jgi:hypothetical protein
VMDLSEIPLPSIKELQRQGEACLQGTVQLALAADQRATTLTGIFGAGAVALLAAAATVLAGAHPDLSLVCGAGVTSLFLLGGAISCAWAGRPIDFFVTGYEPRLLAQSATDEVWMLRYAIEDIQTRIDANRRALERSARLLYQGALIAMAAVLAGAGTFLSLWSSASHPFS